VRILVTGGAGFIGSHVVDAYISMGHEVVVVDDLSTGRAENLNPGVKFFRLDIRDPGLIEVFQSFKPQVVNHHAAQIDVRRSMEDPVFDAEVNIVGTLRVLECSRRFSVGKVVLASTGGAIYGEPKYLPADEDHPVSPMSSYGIGKYAAEHFCRMYSEQRAMSCVVLRYANVYGPRQDPLGEAGVVAIFTNSMLKGKTPTIYGDGTQVRDFVYVDDVARASVLALEHSPSRPINIGTGAGTTVNALYQALADLIGFTVPPVYAAPRPGEVHTMYLDCRRSREELGWQPAVGLTEGLRRTVQSLREHSS